MMLERVFTFLNARRVSLQSDPAHGLNRQLLRLAGPSLVRAFRFDRRRHLVHRGSDSACDGRDRKRERDCE